MKIEEISGDEEPALRHDHPILASDNGQWVLFMQERGRPGPVRGTYATKGEALRAIAADDWAALLHSLERMQAQEGNEAASGGRNESALGHSVGPSAIPPA